MTSIATEKEEEVFRSSWQQPCLVVCYTCTAAGTDYCQPIQGTRPIGCSTRGVWTRHQTFWHLFVHKMSVMVTQLILFVRNCKSPYRRSPPPCARGVRDRQIDFFLSFLVPTWTIRLHPASFSFLQLAHSTHPLADIAEIHRCSSFLCQY